jgi:hypothetical protein
VILRVGANPADSPEGEGSPAWMALVDLMMWVAISVLKDLDGTPTWTHG